MQIQSELSAPFVAACGLLSSNRVRDLKSRTQIYNLRSEGRTYVVKRGYVRLAFADATGKLFTLMLLGKGSMFGDLPFRPDKFLSQELAITSGMACVMEIRRNEIESHALDSPHFQSMVLQTISAQHSALERRLRWQLVSPIRTRVATALYDLLCFSGGRCGHGHLIDIRLTHEEFAELLVAARPVVSDVLSEFKSSRIIDYTRAHICVLNLDRLQELSVVRH